MKYSFLTLSKCVLWLSMSLLFFHCKNNDIINPIEKTLSYDFANGVDGWVGGFSDWHPPYESNDWGFVADRTVLPSPLNTSQYGFKLSGMNRSDDLFMFMKRKITGLQANTTYKVIFNVEFASNAPTNAVGVGGSPDAVMMKAGMTSFEPIATLDKTVNLYQMNLDKGNQMNDGKDMFNLGTIGVNDTTTQFTLISKNNATRLFSIKTNEKGEAWLIIGTDSGYESRTTLYYTKITLNLLQSIAHE